MQMSVIKQSIGKNEVLYDTNLQQLIDADITLPEYCPDIIRIIKCLVCPNIDSVQTMGNRATAQGDVKLRIVYLGENEKIHCFEQSYPFSKYCEMKDNIESLCVKVRAKTDYVNCRALSSRKADIHACVTISFKGCQKKDEELITDVECSEIEKKKCEISCSCAISSDDKFFTMSETAQMSEKNKSAQSVINYSASALCSEIKVINNKILLKGELIVSVIYCCEGEENDIETFMHSMPINQIIEIEGITEDNLCKAWLDVVSIDVVLREDSTGEKRLFDITAKVGADISVQEEKKMEVLVDAYSTKGEIKLEEKNAEFYTLSDSVNETFLVRSQQDLSSLGASSVEALWCSDMNYNCTVHDGVLLIDGTVTGHFIYKDSSGNVGCAEKVIDFEYKKPLKSDCERFRCEPNIKICDKSVSCTSSGEADIKIEMKLSCDVYSCENKRIITSIEADENKNCDYKKSSLVIYFADKDENLWDIAKHYKTSVEAIKQENSFDEDIVEEKRMLLIPRV